MCRSSCKIIWLRAGLVSTGVSAWQSIGWWGTMFPSTMRPWWNQPVWDTCGCCSDNIQNNKFFGLVNAIFGYQVRCLLRVDLGIGNNTFLVSHNNTMRLSFRARKTGSNCCAGRPPVFCKGRKKVLQINHGVKPKMHRIMPKGLSVRALISPEIEVITSLP